VSDSRPPETPESVAQTTPRVMRSYDEMNTSHMVFEMQGTLGEVKQAVLALDKNLERTAKSLKDEFEKDLSKVNKTLEKHQTTLDTIHRLTWIVTGAWAVILIIGGLVVKYGVSKFFAVFF
jgi:hypothetical protein